VIFADPWSRSDFEEALRSGGPVSVAETRDGAVGYAVGRSVLDEGEILNLGVARAARRQGVGRALVERLMEVFTSRGVRRVFLEVRQSNLAAQRLYAGFGFTAVGRRRQYYRSPAEDAVVLRAVISADTPSA
jgi:ribosomal-protein-alanine N-acetyltransferase